MKKYEALVIFPPQVTVSVLDGGKNDFEEVLSKFQGKIVNRLDMGRRPLGYPIKKVTEGHVVAFTFELAPENVDALKKALQLEEGILKFSLVKKTADIPLATLPQSAHPTERR